MAETHPQKSNDFIQRGVKKTSASGVLTLFVLRGLDPILQFYLLAGGGSALLAKTGVAAIVNGPAVTTGVGLIDDLGLPAAHLVLVAMAAGSAIKQCYWLAALSQEYFPPDMAVGVSVYNTFMNTANTLLFLSGTTSSLTGPLVPGTAIPYTTVVGAVLYAVGIALEAGSEYQRKKFKDDPASKGKVMRTGLWSWARHINYGGYALWRGAYCLAASGWVGGLLMSAFQGVYFQKMAVPLLNDYCAGRYGEQWVRFRRDVKWTLLPGIY
ncbi:hypothetical protein G7046_g7251 [Stylonectria norvegica]|nr:hypothetical protein G7046_g7251 [Stylonectria norvegica]